jgi:hypothetical protein
MGRNNLKLQRLTSKQKLILVAIVFAAIGVVTLSFSRAATNSIGLEAEQGNQSNTQLLASVSGASDGAVRLNAEEVSVGGYEENLAFIRAASGTRNDDFLNSPFRNTPSASLDINNFVDQTGQIGYIPDPLLGSFRTVCYFSHLAYDDPIVFPGKPGVSHLHMFFGNDEANAFSTGDTILNKGSSTCNGHELNRTGYWVPAVFDAAGNVRIPDRMFVYYKSFGPASPVTQIYPKDKSLRIISGAANAEQPQSADFVMHWNCGNRIAGENQAVIPACDDGGVVGNIKFPQCWDGQNGWMAGVAHMAMSPAYYSGTCPASHPIVLPSIELFLEYDSTPGGTTGWYLSSDVRQDNSVRPGGQTFHGDWWDGWNQTVNQTWVSKCTGNFFNCGLTSHIGDGRTLKGWEKLAIEKPAGRPEYSGVRVISPTDIAKLCPGDTYAVPYDSAWCQAKLSTASADVMKLHEQMGHVAGASDSHEGHTTQE